MQLRKLLESLSEYKVYGSVKKDIFAIESDSRQIVQRSLFIAVKGLTVDGHDFIGKAIEKGASVIVGEKDNNKLKLPAGITYVKVDNTRRSVGHLASAFYNYPSKKLKVIGVTGTDGKTTTASLIHHILESAGLRAGLISTIGAKIGKETIDTGLHVTNPDAILLHKILGRMVKEKCEFAVVETTSHGLDQDRVSGVFFDSAVLTNITEEHLDYHSTFEDYKAAKMKLFLASGNFVVLNKDDESFAEFVANLNPKIKIYSYSLKDRRVDYFAQNYNESVGTYNYEIIHGVGSFSVHSTLPGTYNVYNSLAATAVAMEYAVTSEIVKKALSTFKAPKGRLEKIDNDRGYEVYVDFAHTPNSLNSVLSLLKKRQEQNYPKGRLIVVFGCAGERDNKKRPEMAKIATTQANYSIFTAEDPRSEDVWDILKAMNYGAKQTKSNLLEKAPKLSPDQQSRNYFYNIPYRSEAIAFALQVLAKKDDIVVICGKGHERSLAYDSFEHPWSDQEFVKNALDSDPNLCGMILAGDKDKTKLTKVLNKICGRPMISYTLENLRKAKFGNLIVVVGFQPDKVKKDIGPSVGFSNQLRAGDLVNEKISDFLVVAGDNSAFYEPETFRAVFEFHKSNKAKVTFTSLKSKTSQGLGRLVRDEKGKLTSIVEEKDASEPQRKIREVITGLYTFNTAWFKRNVKKIRKSPSGEYYIVDIIKMAIDQKEKVAVYSLKDQNEWIEVNTPEQFEQAQKKMSEKLQLLNGNK